MEKKTRDSAKHFGLFLSRPSVGIGTNIDKIKTNKQLNGCTGRRCAGQNRLNSSYLANLNRGASEFTMFDILKVCKIDLEKNIDFPSRNTNIEIQKVLYIHEITYTCSFIDLD